MDRQVSDKIAEAQPQVFVSHARQDAEKVLEIARPGKMPRRSIESRILGSPTTRQGSEFGDG
jgi:hypothetical protein